MEDSGLVEILIEAFGWNKARVKCFVGMLLALIQVRTVNLTKLACAFSGNASKDSRYKRLKRFFSLFSIDFLLVADWVIKLFGLKGSSLYLSMDRTNWKWGKSDINVLMLSIVYKGIALPLMWTMLSKRGNSNTKERIELVKRFIDRFGKQPIAALLADREFIGEEWFRWLRGEKNTFLHSHQEKHSYP